LSIYEAVKNYLESKGCKLIDMTNVSGMGESYVINFVNNNQNSEEIKRGIVQTIQGEWKK
jgi:nitrogen regulatory protein PII